MWLVAAAALNVALAEEPRRVGPHTGDHPVYRRPFETEISWPAEEVVDVFALPRTRFGCVFTPPYLRTNFRADIDASARLAVPVDRVAP